MTQPSAFGGEGGELDPTVRYRSSRQNYVIDTGDEATLLPRRVRPLLPSACKGHRRMIEYQRPKTSTEQLFLL